MAAFQAVTARLLGFQPSVLWAEKFNGAGSVKLIMERYFKSTPVQLKKISFFLHCLLIICACVFYSVNF